MGRLTLPPTGNPALDSTLRLIDEQLSELYSLHGRQTPREEVNSGTITLRHDLGNASPITYGRLYRDMTCIGMAIVSQSGNISFAKNIEAFDGSLTSWSTTGIYGYRFKGVSLATRANSYVVIPVNNNGLLGPTGAYFINAAITGTSTFNIYIGDGTNYVDWAHSFVCFGQLENQSVAS